MVLFDFDGTIVDLWQRYYSVFVDLLHLKDLSLSAYKKRKLLFHSDSLVAKDIGCVLPEDYYSKKASLLEERKYLIKDTLLLDLSVLNSVLRQDAAILTKRRNKEAFIWQMNYLGIEGTPFVIENSSKKQWIESTINDNQSVTIIGDSIAELECATLPNVDAWMVGYGLNTKESFNSLNIPYSYYHDPNDLNERIRSLCNKCNSVI